MLFTLIFVVLLFKFLQNKRIGPYRYKYTPRFKLALLAYHFVSSNVTFIRQRFIFFNKLFLTVLSLNL